MFFNLLRLVLVVYCVAGWFADPHSKLMHTLTRITDPILAPIRHVLFRSAAAYRYSGFAPLVALLLIQFLQGLIMSL